MKKISIKCAFVGIISFIAMFSFTLGSGTCKEAKKPSLSTKSQLPHFSVQTKNIYRANGDCGGLVLDKRTGMMKRRPNVDLIVSKIEIIRRNDSAMVKPTIKNRCTGNITKSFKVLIGDVLIQFPSFPGNTEQTIGGVLLPAAFSYTVVVDYGNKIAESNEGNNRCIRSATGGCR